MYCRQTCIAVGKRSLRVHPGQAADVGPSSGSVEAWMP